MAGKVTELEAAESIAKGARNRQRHLRLDVTLIATFWSVEPLMPAALTFQPTRLILLVNKTDGDVKDNVAKVRETFGKVVEVKVEKMPEDDLVGFATRFVEILDQEPRNRFIVVSIGGGRRLDAAGAIFGCYARPDRIYKIVGKTPKDTVSELPKMGYSIGTQKKEILKIQAEGKDKTVQQIAGLLGKTRGMIYQHLRELREQGYVDDEFNITDAGRLALL